LVKDSDILRARIKTFLSLKHITYHLISNDEAMNKRLKQNPLKFEEREIGKWIEGNNYNFEKIENEPMLCNVRINSKMHVRYLLNDQDYFVLVEFENPMQGD
jgi:hypothetical protein